MTASLTDDWAFLWSEVLPLGLLSWLYGCVVLKVAPSFSRQDIFRKIAFAIPLAAAGHLVKVAARPYYGGGAFWWDLAGFTVALVIYSMIISEKDRITEKLTTPVELLVWHCVILIFFAIFVILPHILR